MKLVEKRTYYNELYSIYYKLLTERQRHIFELSFFDDYSLQEVADLQQISRNAVYDALKTVEERLDYYEESLNLFKLSNLRKEYIDSYLKTNDKKYLELLRKMDDELWWKTV